MMSDKDARKTPTACAGWSGMMMMMMMMMMISIYWRRNNSLDIWT